MFIVQFVIMAILIVAGVAGIIYLLFRMIRGGLDGIRFNKDDYTEKDGSLYKKVK